jgi:capsular polysaccharide biosynthesis protein
MIKGGKTVELQEYLQIIRKRWLLILSITLAAAIVSAAVSYFIIKPTYKSDISVIIGKVDSGSDVTKQATSYNDILMYQKLVKTYSELVKSRTVAENAIKGLGLDMKASAIQGMTSVAPKGDTEFLTITVRSKNPEQAMLIANQLAKSLKEVSIDVKKMDNVMILDSAQLPTGPESPRPMLNIAIAFFLGLMVSVGLVFLLEYLDSTVKTQDDIERLLGVPVLGVIPFVAEIK